MKRRAFLQSILAAGVAPSIVRVESLMKIVVPTTGDVVRYSGGLFMPELWNGRLIEKFYDKYVFGFYEDFALYDSNGKSISGTHYQPLTRISR